MNIFVLILIPLISGLVGYLTNWIAVKMLFRPKEKVNLGLFSIQGVFPANQQNVAEKIGSMVATELLSSADIKERMTHADNITAIRNLVEDKIDEYLNVTFTRNYPIISKLFGQKRRDKFKLELANEVERMAPDVVGKFVEDIEHKLNVKDIISKKVAELPPDKLEEMLNKILKKEFEYIEYIGGVIGFVIGLLQILLIYIL